MRTFFLLTTLVFAICAVSIRSSAVADEAKDSKAKDSKATQAAKDPNYRWSGGQWFYWIAKDKSWVVWTGDKWVPFSQAQASRGATRSFSYQGNSADARLFGTPLRGMPDNVSNTQIMGSYGFRSAGSKATGNY